eukprot:GCRY01003230.1.p1 GENE.GCRY01003230.1~~GCRY01003230.1.p1  ORF type:complete len:559 (+),score=153.04 GCRY01003230.1:151-1827(+)
MKVQIEGYLYKLAGSVNGWQKRWMYIEGGALNYSKKPGDLKISNCVNLFEIISVEPVEEGKYNKPFAFEIATPSRVWSLYAASEWERNNWIEHIKMNCVAKDEDTVAAAKVKKGFMMKEGAIHKAAKRRFFVLFCQRLLYYATEEDYKTNRKPRGVISLKQFNLRDMQDEKNKPGCFAIEIPKRTYYIQAPTEADMEDWMLHIQGERQTTTTHASENFDLEDDDKGKGISLKDFQMLHVLGRGTYGKVILARHRRNGCVYAVKVILKNALKEKEIVNTLAESRVLRNMGHPFIVKLRCALQTEDKLYLIMDYIPGGDLFTFMDGMPVKKEIARFFIAELALALEYIHTHDIVYRDLKTENILIDQDGHIKLADFGLAKEDMSADTRLKRTVCGSADTLAPEMLLGKPYGAELDWWGLGCILYELLTGRPPFYSENVEQQFDNILKCRPVYPAHMDPEAADLIKSLLKYNREERATVHQIKAHPFFAPINWDALYRRDISPPKGCRPVLSGDDDVSNFDEEFTNMRVDSITVGEAQSANSASKGREFRGFTFVDESAFS